MRKLMLLIAVVGLAGSLWGVEPWVGTWKLNIAKSKFPPSAEAAPREGTIVVRELGADEFELALTRTQTDGSHSSQRLTWPQKGGALKSQTAPSEGRSSVVTMIEPGEWYTTALQNGKQVQLIHSVVSKDGKTMRLTVKGTDAQGKPSEQLAVFDKQ